MHKPHTRQIYQDTIRDLLAVPTAAAPLPPPTGGSAYLGGSGGGGGPKLLSWRDPDPSKDIVLLGLEEVQVGLNILSTLFV